MEVERRARGRPRDPDVERRVYDAVLSVYGATGWSGFTLEAVAKLAGVGREALYRRWSGKAELLAQAVHAHSPVLEAVDTGDSRTDLTVVARHFLSSYRAPVGIVGLRMVLDARSVPELADHFATIARGERLARTRQVVLRAVGRGDLPEGTSTTSVVEVLTGATLAHVLFTGGREDPAADDRHVRRLVSLLLHSGD